MTTFSLRLAALLLAGTVATGCNGNVARDAAVGAAGGAAGSATAAAGAAAGFVANLF